MRLQCWAQCRATVELAPVMVEWPATITLAGVLPHIRMLPTVLTKMLPPLQRDLQQ